MAGDWIKVQKATARKPEVLQIADKLGVHPDHAFALCVRFWFWCDDQMTDGHAAGVTEVTLDSVFGHAGFVSALISVGWLRVREGSLEVPHFDRHLSDSAKNRALSGERKQKQRDRQAVKQSRSQRDKSVTREEKRREDVSSLEETRTRDGPVLDFDGEYFLFESWWKVYPRRSGKKATFDSWKRAIVGIRQQREFVDHGAAAEWLLAVTVEFADSPKGKSDFVVNPSKWLDEGRWDDDRSEWQRDSGTSFTQGSARQRAANPGSSAGSEDEWAARFEAEQAGRTAEATQEVARQRATR